MNAGQEWLRSAGSKGWTVSTLLTLPGHFPNTLLSCWISGIQPRSHFASGTEGECSTTGPGIALRLLALIACGLPVALLLGDFRDWRTVVLWEFVGIVLIG